MTVKHTTQPETAEVNGPEAEELLGKLTAPLGGLGQMMLGLSLGILAEGGSVQVIRHVAVEDDGEPEYDY